MTIDFWENPQGRSPVADFIESLPEKAKKKIVRTLELVEKYGTGVLHSGLMKKLQGYDLYEFRIDFNKVRYRILCTINGLTCVLLHMFVKKGPNTPSREITTALQRAGSL